MIYSRFIGVDGCKAGWFYVGITVLGECDFGVFKTLPELCHADKKDTLILVDIPIGLPSKKNLSRECDIMARKLLRPLRHSSVFSPPCRETLYKANYAEACDINAAVTGRKISLQAWNIATKIREVDNLLQDHPKSRAVIRECHPEICFYGLNNGSPMERYKKTGEGQEKRLELLTKYFEKSRTIFKAAQDRFLRKEVARDDIVDALVAAVTGFLSKGDLVTLPEKPDMDERGRPMEMVYFHATPEESIEFPGGETAVSGMVSEMLSKCGHPDQNFPATELYNETWMLRLVVNWFSNNSIPGNPLNFAKGCRWFSEGQIPTQFQPTSRKDKLGEAWTHADCVIGHF